MPRSLELASESKLEQTAGLRSNFNNPACCVLSVALSYPMACCGFSSGWRLC